MGKRVLSALVLLVCLTACNRDPNVAKRKYLDSGNKFFEKGKYKEALIMYRKALQRDLKFGEAYYRAGLADLRLQRWGDGARDLQRAIELQPENLDAHNRLANLYLNAYAADRKRSKGLLNELHALSDKYSRQFPNSYEDARLKGYLALFDANAKGALEHFEKANRTKPHQTDLVLVYMQTLAATGQAPEAEKLGLEMIEKQPAALPIYDALFAYYVRSKRLPEAHRMLQQKVEKNPKVPDGYIQLAGYHFNMKEREPMMNTLARLTSNTKDFPQGPKYVGDFFMRIREYDLALQHYRDGEKNAPNAGEKHAYQKRMIEVLVKQSKKDEAQRIIQQVIKENPKDSEAIAIRGSISLLSANKEQLQSAVNDLQSVVSKMPNNPVVRYNLGRALLATQNVQAARVQLEEAIKIDQNYLLPRVLLADLMLRNREFQKVVQASQDILGIDPLNVPARLLRSRALIGMNDTRGAREVLTQAPGKFSELPEARLQIAAIDFQEKNFKQAEDSFRNLYTQSQDPRAFMGLIETLVAQKETAQAMKLLREEAAKQPDRMEYRVAMGNLAVGTGDYPTAIGEYKKVLEKVPASSDVWMRLGETQRRTGDTASAAAAYKKAQELAPNSAQAFVQLALLYDVEGRRMDARPYYEQALRVQPNNMIALNNLAYMMADAGADLDQALTMAQKAKQQQPNNNNITDTLSWIYIKKNLPDTAIGLLRDLVQKEPERATYRYHLAFALHQKGDKAQAKREAELALKSKPAKDEEAKIRDLLSKLG